MNVAYAIIFVLINYGLDLSGYIHPIHRRLYNITPQEVFRKSGKKQKNR